MTKTTITIKIKEGSYFAKVFDELQKDKRLFREAVQSGDKNKLDEYLKNTNLKPVEAIKKGV